jgi:hypothetical protein
LLGSSTMASHFFRAFGRFWRLGVVWGGDFGEWRCGGEQWWRACSVGGFWRGGVVWGGDFREWTCGGKHCWGACSVGGFWGGVVWGGDFGEWPRRGEWCWGEWCSSGCVDGGFSKGGVVCGGFWDGGVNQEVLHMVFWEVLSALRRNNRWGMTF